MTDNGFRSLARPVWRAFKVAVLAGVVAAAVYWLRFSPVPVVEHRVDQGEIVAEVMGTGTLEARVKSTISPKISGRILEISADQGDRVEAGAVLVQLDDAELKQQVEIAQAGLDAAKAAMDRLQADHARAQSIAEQAQKEHGRVVKLSAGRVVSEADRDKAVESLGIAEAGLARARAALVEGEKQLDAARKTLDYHRARLADTRIVAPFAGLIVRRQRDPGDVVVPGSPILTLVSTEVLWISAWVDETEMAGLRSGQPARVVFRSEPERSYPGAVARLGRETDRETREFTVDVQVVSLPANWAVGQRAEVYVEVDRKPSVTLLPAEYVVWRDAEPGVFVDLRGRARWRPVRLGLRGRERVEAMEGLAPGETVVMPLGGKDALADGRRIASS